MPDEKPPNPDAVAPGSPPPHPVPPGAVSAEPMNVPPIKLDPTAKPSPASVVAKKESDTKDTFRELIETIVFVVVLVLMLKTFLAEAFVIPTGSMATTLLGYHHKMTCPQCGYTNLVNASAEADPQGRPPEPVVAYECENCDFWHTILELRLPPPQGGGDR